MTCECSCHAQPPKKSPWPLGLPCSAEKVGGAFADIEFDYDTYHGLSITTWDAMAGKEHDKRIRSISMDDMARLRDALNAERTEAERDAEFVKHAGERGIDLWCIVEAVAEAVEGDFTGSPWPKIFEGQRDSLRAVLDNAKGAST